MYSDIVFEFSHPIIFIKEKFHTLIFVCVCELTHMCKLCSSSTSIQRWKKQPQTRKLVHCPLFEIYWWLPSLKCLWFLFLFLFYVYSVSILGFSLSSSQICSPNSAPFEPYHIFFLTGCLSCLCFIPLHIHQVQCISNNIENIEKTVA